jgi:hypothetical protein
MHVFDKDMPLRMIDIVKSTITSKTQLWVNIGDTDYDTFGELKKARVSLKGKGIQVHVHPRTE